MRERASANLPPAAILTAPVDTHQVLDTSSSSAPSEAAERFVELVELFVLKQRRTSGRRMGRRTRDAEAELGLPPGFRFHPTDEELVVHYLCRKAAGQPLPVPIIAEVDLYKFDPWDLPEMALFGNKEWYFFTPRDRKYPNGLRPNRAAGSGYWKATGADKPVSPAGSERPAGIKKALVFYHGKAPGGVKTDWIMHEYRLADVDRSANRGNLRLDDWVLCHLYHKKNIWEKMQQEKERSPPRPSSSQASRGVEEGNPASSIGFHAVDGVKEEGGLHEDLSLVVRLHQDSLVGVSNQDCYYFGQGQENNLPPFWC